VTVPFLAIDGPADFFSDSASTESRSDKGIGDILVRTSYVWLPLSSSLWPVVELQAQVKIPTADESKKLGTGARTSSWRWTCRSASVRSRPS
jgi:hypothetical protein